MTRQRTLAELAAFQREFSALLRTPLERESGALRAPSEAYDAALTAQVEGRARERLAVYHRQYWFRLFTTMQREFPLCARLLGMWTFNGLASDYLLAHPPAHYDLQRIAHGFVAFVEERARTATRLQGLPAAAVVQAARIDAAFSRVFHAPEVPPLKHLPRADPMALQLKLSPTVALLSERWPLLELRRQIAHHEALALPAAHEVPRYWAVFRTESGHGVAPLEPLAYQLFTLLATQPLGTALAELEARCPAQERAQLPAQVQALLARSVSLGFWKSVEAQAE